MNVKQHKHGQIKLSFDTSSTGSNKIVIAYMLVNVAYSVTVFPIKKISETLIAKT